MKRCMKHCAFCGAKTKEKCENCGSPVCAEHADYAVFDDVVVCVKCAKELLEAA